MARGIIDTKTIVSLLTAKRKRNMMPSMMSMGIAIGAGIAYMAVKKGKHDMIK